MNPCIRHGVNFQPLFVFTIEITLIDVKFKTFHMAEMRQLFQKGLNLTLKMMKISNLNPVAIHFHSMSAQIGQAFVVLTCCEGAWCCKIQCIGIHTFERLLQMCIPGGKVTPVSWRKRTTP